MRMEGDSSGLQLDAAYTVDTRLEGVWGLRYDGVEALMNDNKISGLIVAGLLAVLGTVAGGVVKGYWDTNLAQMDFQSKLVLRALEHEDATQRVSSLQFLVKANLISDPTVVAGLQEILQEGEDSIPQFLPVRSQGTLGSFGVESVASPKEQLVEKFPTLQGKKVALIGFRLRSGDIIDAVTPIFAEVTPRLELKGEFEGDRIGGTGGTESVLKHPNHVVTGFDIQRGAYFGRSEVVHIQVIWHRLTRNGIDPNSTIVSDKLGSGNYADISDPPKQFRAKGNAFISDFAATISSHTSGETFE